MGSEQTGDIAKPHGGRWFSLQVRVGWAWLGWVSQAGPGFWGVCFCYSFTPPPICSSYEMSCLCWKEEDIWYRASHSQNLTHLSVCRPWLRTWGIRTRPNKSKTSWTSWRSEQRPWTASGPRTYLLSGVLQGLCLLGSCPWSTVTRHAAALYVLCSRGSTYLGSGTMAPSLLSQSTDSSLFLTPQLHQPAEPGVEHCGVWEGTCGEWDSLIWITEYSFN